MSQDHDRPPQLPLHPQKSPQSPSVPAESPPVTEPLVAFAVVHGFAAGSVSAYSLARVPDDWKTVRRWMVWLPFRHKRWSWVRRVLLAPATGEPAGGSSPKFWVDYEDALARARAWGLGRQSGGVAFVYPNPETGDAPPRGIIFFQLAVREATTPQLTIFAEDGPDPGPFPEGESGGQP